MGCFGKYLFVKSVEITWNEFAKDFNGNFLTIPHLTSAYMNHLISVYVQEVYKTTIIRQILAIQDVIRADPKFAIVKGPAGAQYCPK